MIQQQCNSIRACKKILIVLLTAALSHSCGQGVESIEEKTKTHPKPQPEIQPTQTPQPYLFCSVSEKDSQVTISCPDNTSVSWTLPENGKDGVDGVNGKDGAAGERGVEGSPGASGSSCSVMGNQVVCTDNTSYILPTPFPSSTDIRVVGYVDPCGKESTFDEIFLRLSDGSLAAFFVANDSALTGRLSIIPDGSYQTTDNTSCTFTLSTNALEGIRTISGKGVTESWSILDDDAN